MDFLAQKWVFLNSIKKSRLKKNSVCGSVQQ